MGGTTRLVSRDLASRSRLLIGMVVAVAITPLVVATVVEAVNGWRPLGDNAVISVFAHDVLSTATPFVGMPSTIGLELDEPIDAHHPGPMVFWALAGPERATGSAPIGLLLGAVLVSAIAIATIGFVTRRVAGVGAATFLLLLAAVLMWALGRQTIVSPWNPHIALLPMLAMFVLAWATLAGRTRLLWAVALFASFVAQAHLVYVPLAVVAFASAAVGAGYSLARRAHRGGPWKRETLVVTAGTAVAILSAWVFPIVDELAHSPGNVGLLRDSWDANTDTGAGTGYALRVLVEAVGAPPLFARQATAIGGIAPPWSHISTLRVASALVIVIALVAGTVLAVRRRDRIAAAAGGLAIAFVLTTGLVVSRLALDFGGVLRYRLLQCWIVGCFVWFATGVVLTRAIVHHRPPIDARHRRALATIAGVTAVGVLLAVPVAVAGADSDGRADPRFFRAVDRVADGTEPHLDRAEAYRLDLSTGRALGSLDVYYGILRELLRRGFDVGLPPDDPYLARSHAAPDYAARVVLVIGRDAPIPLESRARRVAEVEFATPEDVARAEESADALRTYLRDEARLTAKGRQARAAGSPRDAPMATLAALYGGIIDPITLVDSGQIDALVLAGFLGTDLPSSDVFRSYLEARHLTEDLVFSVYLVP